MILQHAETHRSYASEANNRVTGSIRRAECRAKSPVPQEVTDTVEEVVAKGTSQRRLDKELGPSRHVRHNIDQRGRRDKLAQTHVWGAQVGYSGRIERTTQSDTRDTMSNRAAPCKLRLVNLEVRRNRAIITSGIQLLQVLLFRHRGRRHVLRPGNGLHLGRRVDGTWGHTCGTKNTCSLAQRSAEQTRRHKQTHARDLKQGERSEAGREAEGHPGRVAACNQPHAWD